MHPWLKPMGFEEVAYIPDPEAGLKEGEEPPPLPAVEESDPDLLKYRPWPVHEILELHPAIPEAAPKDPLIAAFVDPYDRLHAPRG
jgi:hypothetical protein